MIYDNGMNFYPLTPPQSNEDTVFSNISPNTLPSASRMESVNNLPYLKIITQPVDKFRFRYKSEMAGTHGSLSGYSSSKSKKQAFPTVQLCNFNKPAIITCILYQYNKNNQEYSQPHPHRLIKKEGSEEVDDPHKIRVSHKENYIATFHSMGIIHTSKKSVVDELFRKKKILKIENASRLAKRRINLTCDEEKELRMAAEMESKSINFNIVCLRFDAYIEIDNILYHICKPVYSHPIYNLKSAETGELKIVRMDHYNSPCEGGKEIFILVEKVTRKNIEIRFYELDENGFEIWYDYGKFNELDVHHQYAIVFRTPPYKNLDINKSQTVYIELVRPSDGAKSEPKEFIYTPKSCYKIGSKRPKTSYSSFDSYNSNELPLTLKNLSNPSQNNFDVSSDKLEEIIKNMDLEKSLEQVVSDEFFYALFTPTVDSGKDKHIFLSEAQIKSQSESEKNEVKRSYKELLSFLKTQPTRERRICYVDGIFEHSSKKDSIFYNAVKHNDLIFVEIVLKLLVELNKLELLNRCNKLSITPLHVAVITNNYKITSLLIKCKVDLFPQDSKGNTPLHIAVKNENLEIVKLLLRGMVKHEVDIYNYNGLTSLHLAIKLNRFDIVKLLCENGANVNFIDKKNGRTPLHIAVCEQQVEIIKYLLSNENLDVVKTDYNGNSPLLLAKSLIDLSKPVTKEVHDILYEFMDSNDLTDESGIKMEIDLDEEDNKIGLEILPEISTVLVKNEFSLKDLKYMYDGVATFDDDFKDVCNVLDISKKYEELAHFLELDSLLTYEVFEGESPSKALLQYAVNVNKVNLFKIRQFLEFIKENEVVNLLDQVVISKT